MADDTLKDPKVSPLMGEVKRLIPMKPVPTSTTPDDPNTVFMRKLYARLAGDLAAAERNFDDF